MCNRYRAMGREALIAYARELLGIEWDIPGPRYNIAPNQTAPIFVKDDAGNPAVTVARWNLIPHFEGEKSGYLRTNARSEDVLAKPSYREAAQKRRCLVPGDGFYEWEWADGGKVKLPWAFELAGGHPFSFAGLWERGGEEKPPSFTILTTKPNELLAKIHDRMPVVLSDADARRWITPGPLNPESLAPFVTPFPAARMNCYRVNQALNSVRNDTAEAAAPRNSDDSIAKPAQGELF